VAVGDIDIELVGEREEEDEDETVKKERGGKRRAWAVDGLYALAKSTGQDQGTVRQLLRLLLCLGFFTSSEINTGGEEKRTGKQKKESKSSAADEWIFSSMSDVPKVGHGQ